MQSPPPKVFSFQVSWDIIALWWKQTNKNPNQRAGPSQHCPELAQIQAHLERNGPGKEVMARGGLGTYAFNGKDKQFLPFG